MTDLRNANISLSGILKLRIIRQKEKVSGVFDFLTPEFFFLGCFFFLPWKLELSSQEFHTFISEVCYNYVKMLYHIDPELAA